jgi:hypothetical protein
MASWYTTRIEFLRNPKIDQLNKITDILSSITTPISLNNDNEKIKVYLRFNDYDMSPFIIQDGKCVMDGDWRSPNLPFEKFQAILDYLGFPNRGYQYFREDDNPDRTFIRSDTNNLNIKEKHDLEVLFPEFVKHIPSSSLEDTVDD